MAVKLDGKVKVRKWKGSSRVVREVGVLPERGGGVKSCEKVRMRVSFGSQTQSLHKDARNKTSGLVLSTVNVRRTERGQLSSVSRDSLQSQ